MVDSGELDLHLLNLFEELVATSQNLIYVNSYYAINEVMVSPLFEACFDCNIIWKSKYYGYFTLDNPLSAFVINQWVEERRATMNPYDRLLFWLFKKSKGIKLGSGAQGLPKIKEK